MKKWIISESQYSSPFLKKTKQFGRRDSVYLVDQYDGKLPILLDDDAFIPLVGKDVRPSALFDSNIMDMINKRANGCRHPGFERLLYFMTVNQWDFIPDFYLLEHYCKTLEAGHASYDSFACRAKKRLGNWLDIYAMDQDLFLKSYVIQRSSEAEESYCSRFGVGSLADIVDYKIEDLIASSGYIQEIKRLINVSKVLIYKMILLRCFEAKG